MSEFYDRQGRPMYGIPQIVCELNDQADVDPAAKLMKLAVKPKPGRRFVMVLFMREEGGEG